MVQVKTACRIRRNKVLYQVYRSHYVITSIKISRPRWAENVERISDDIKIIMDCKTEGRRTGRPKLRWIDGIMEDIKKLVVKNRWAVARVREA
jgi:hypothetical protein